VGDASRLLKLTGFLVRDLARLAEVDFQPVPDELEQRFSLASSELPGEALPAAGEFRLGGVVDRVDRDPEGRELVLDYKRSDKHSEPPDSDAPALFQLALYALARARDSRGEVLGAAYHALDKDRPFRGYFREELREATAPWSVGGSRASATGGHWLDAEAWEAWLENVSRRLKEIVAEIRAGALNPAPLKGEETCRYCDFRPLCRWEADREEAEHG